MAVPKISCVLLNRPGREVETLRALDDFAGQSHTNRELVVVTTADDQEDVAQLRWRLTHRAEGLSVPADALVVVQAPADDLRPAVRYNAGLDAVTGALVCLWDARDRQHPNRLAAQYRHLSYHDAGCTLAAWYFHASAARALYWVDRRHEAAGSDGDVVPDTLLAWKRDDVRLAPAESNPYTAFLAAAGRHGRIAVLGESPHLTIVTRPVLPKVLWARALRANDLKRHSDTLRLGLAAYPGLAALEVKGGCGTTVLVHRGWTLDC